MKILLLFILLFNENLASSPAPINVADNEIAKVNDLVSSSTSTISIIVTPLNDTLVANDITVVVEEDVSGYEISLSATDAENSTLTFSIVDSPLYGEVDTTTLGDSRVRAYESRNAGQHQHNSHYSGSPNTIEGQANAVVSHLVNGHPSASWRDIYSITADDPWVSTYSRGTDGELRPSLLSTVGPGLGSGLKGGHLFVPEVMFETFKAAFNNAGQAILEDTANYVMFGDTGGKVLYTPNENFFGTDSFTYVATDNNGVVSSKATVSITVTPVSDEPTSSDATLNLSEDSTGFIILPGSDADGDTLTFTVGAASNGTVTLVGDTALYTPNPNYNGKDSFVYTVSDGISSSTSTITITVAPVNDVPVADDISVTVAEDSSVTITLSASDVDDTTNSSVEFFQVGEEYVGANDFDRIGSVISLSGDGSTIAFGVGRDDTNGSNTGLVRLFRKEGNNLSQLGADIYGAEANDRLGKDVSLNHDGTILAVTSMSDIIVYEYTDTVWIETGRVMFSENDDDEPIYIMDYTIQLNSDGTILSVSGGEYEDTVVKTYKKQTDNNWSQLGSEITGFRYLLKNSMSLSSDGLTVAIGDPSNSGEFEGDAGEARVFKFIDGDWTQLGSDLNGENNAHNFGYSTSLSSDGSKLAVSAIRSSSIGYVKTYEYVDSDWIQLGSTISGESRERFGSDISLSGDGSLIAISATGHNSYAGRVAVYQFADSTWSQVGDILEGKERYDQNGESVSLSKDASTLVIGSVNGSSRYIGSIEMYELEGLGSSELTYSVVGQPTYGSLDTVSTETTSDTTITVINYTPEKDYNGSDTFTYTATDSKGGVSDKATVSITVTPVNDAPTSSSSSDNLDEDALTTFYLSGEDIDGDTLTYIITDSVKNGTIELIDIFGRVKYIPDSNFFGIDSVKFKVNDGILDSDTSTFTLTINSVYDLPEIIFSLVDSISTEEDESTIPISIKLEGVDAGDEYVTFDLMLSGTASDSDYTVSSTSVVMDTGVVEATANITIIDDAVYEEEETIVIGVENVSNALDTVQSVTITILRNDVPLGENSHRIISRVYPNPAKDYFTIEFSEIFELEEIDMVDPLGRVYAPSIIEINKKQLKIDSSILSGGTHILRLKTDKGSASFRIIVE